MAMERLALVGAARRMDERREIQLNELFVKRVPVFVAHAWRLSVPFAWIGVDHDADEAEVVNAAVELVERVFRAYAGALRQSADTTETLRLELHLEGDGVVNRLA